MNLPPPEYPFFIALAIGVTGISLLLGSPAWYLNIALLLLVCGILVITRTWHDRGFFLVCGGEPLVVACGIMNLWVGLFSACMLAGIVYGALGLLESRKDILSFALFCGGAFFVALLIQVSNHVPLVLLIIGGVTAIILAIQSVRTYQFRKQYTGA